MKKITLNFFKYFLIITGSLFLVTIGIDAADHYNAISESIVGKIFFKQTTELCPVDMAYVPDDDKGFCIDKYEASPGDKCVYSEIKNQSETRVNLEAKDCQAVSSAGARPWNYISQPQAMAACAKAGKRLATDKEWYLASLGTPDKKNNWTEDDCQVDANWPDQPGLAGAGINCFSSAGAYDMVGNVWEWVKGEIKDGLYEGQAMPGEGYIKSVDINGLPVETGSTPDPNFNEDFFWLKDKDIRGMARGGYWDNKASAGIYAMYLVAPPAYAGVGVGFRCAK
jgi:formylglycine-generating enzyme required for sulfatase activity